MKKIWIIAFTTLAVLFSCNVSSEKNMNENNVFYLGTYTGGESEGIYKYRFNSDGTIQKIGLVAQTDNPSFLAFGNDKHVLLAVNEVDKEGSGIVQSFLIEEDTLKLLSTSMSGGAHPCHVGISGHQVVVANYSGGNIGWLSLNKSGYLSELISVSQHEGSDLKGFKQTPHAHSVCFVADEIISADLGTDELWVYDSINRQLKQRVKLKAGAGPRHMCLHPNGHWLYVVNELNNTVTRVDKTNKGWDVAESVATLPADFAGTSYGADVHITGDGRFLYASNRGHNSIAIFKVSEHGVLEVVGHEPVRGDHPRNFALSPDEKFLLVANKNTNNLVVFERDFESGFLTFVSECKAPSPVCILFE